ncbi:MAG: chromosomal replication initiator protein DnaA [Treponema sp.]|nr:chromosomal replication initiator protein DnaA [Treponema sp.]
MASNVYKEFWREALKQIEQENTSNNSQSENYFSLWFNIEYIKDDDNVIFVSFPSEFMLQKMKKDGNIKLIEKKVQELTGNEKIKIEASAKSIEKKTSSIQTSVQEKKEAPIKKENTTKDAPKKHKQLRENFTFNTFVYGENNDLAYKAAYAVAENPGKKWNPLLLYGGVGLGKTHLMQAIGNFVYEKTEEKSKICYISAENFTNEFTSSLATKTVEKFKSKYRNLDVLLLDDIHFLQGKKGIQEEIFYVFNALRDKNAQLVFTCDRPINELKEFESRLQTRLTNGLVADMQMPNFETRVAIIKKKLTLLKTTIPNDIIDYIAKNIETNVRDLESAITKMLGYTELIQKPLTLEIAKDQLKDIFNTPFTENVSIETIQKIVAANYNISVSDIKGKKRDKKIVTARHIAVYLSRELTESSFQEIANEFGGKDHSTMMHAAEKIEAEIKIDSTLDTKIKAIIEEIKNTKN